MRYLALFFLLLSFSACIAENKTTLPHISAYTLTLRLDSASRKISTVARLEIENPHIGQKTALLFSHCITLDSAYLNSRNLDFSRSGDTLSFTPAKLKSGSLLFYYTIPADSFQFGKIILLTRAMKWCPYLHDNISSLNVSVTVPGGFSVYSSGVPGRMTAEKNHKTFTYSNQVNSGLPVIIARDGDYSGIERQQNGILVKYCF
jgi:hypothetical protein